MLKKMVDLDFFPSAKFFIDHTSTKNHVIFTLSIACFKKAIHEDSDWLKVLAKRLLRIHEQHPVDETDLTVVSELPTKKFQPKCVNKKSSLERRYFVW